MENETTNETRVPQDDSITSPDLPIFDVIAGPEPDYTHTVRLTFKEPCAFCGRIHVHGDRPWRAIPGAILRRSAHCVSDRPKRGMTVAPKFAYLIRVVSS